MLSFRNITGGFVNLKLYSVSPVCHKANYWLGFDRKNHRFTALADHFLLKANRPDLYHEIKTFLEDYYD